MIPVSSEDLQGWTSQKLSGPRLHLSMQMSFFHPSAFSVMETLAKHSNLGAHVFRVRTRMFRETHAWQELMDSGSEQPTQTPSLLPTDHLWEETATSLSFRSPWWV